MSYDVNARLEEEAVELIESGELSSTPMEGMLRNDLEAKDMESLWKHLVEANNFLREDDEA